MNNIIHSQADLRGPMDYKKEFPFHQKVSEI